MCSCPANTIVHSYSCCNTTYTRNVSQRPIGEEKCHIRTGLIVSERNWGIGGLCMASHSGTLSPFLATGSKADLTEHY